MTLQQRLTTAHARLRCLINLANKPITCDAEAGQRIERMGVLAREARDALRAKDADAGPASDA